VSVEEHVRLQNAVKNQLWRDRHIDEVDGNVAGDFDPMKLTNLL